MTQPTGRLFIVGTPIGNLEDITLRALRVLREADLVAAEDTRHTGMLLRHFEIHKPLISYHEFNEARRCPELIQKLKQGTRIALVSDAGMPTLSDPGMRLIRAALDQQVPIEVIPGPSAITTALVAAGIPAKTFQFVGFLPYKGAQRRKTLAELAHGSSVLVFFESPYRVRDCIADMHKAFGNRQAVIARELTKKFEEFMRGDLVSLMKRLENKSVKGEITIIVEGHSK